MNIATSTTPKPRTAVIYRHRLPVRIMHWINFIALGVLLMSGLQIFNAHPHLYWGQSSYSARPPLLSMEAKRLPDGRTIGVTRIWGHEFDTTGWLGLSETDGYWQERGFPDWVTLPGPQWLAMARRWHFFFAWAFVLNGLAYLIYTIASRHLERDLMPTRDQLGGIGRSIRDHLQLRHTAGEEARQYNVLQKLAYLIVIFVLLPVIVVMGLGLSPALNSLSAGWVDWFGGRQSMRTLHFVAALALFGFFLIHVFEVAVTGLWNNLRSMITGRYRLPP